MFHFRCAASVSVNHYEQRESSGAWRLNPQYEVLVRVEGVSKIFCRDLKKSLWYGLQDSTKDLFSFGKQRSEVGSSGRSFLSSDF